MCVSEAELRLLPLCSPDTMVSELLLWAGSCAMGNDQGNPSGSSKATPLVSGRGHSDPSLHSQLLAQDPVKGCLTMNPPFLNMQLWRPCCGPAAELGFKGSVVGQAVHGGRRKRPGVGSKHVECIDSDGKKDRTQ